MTRKTVVVIEDFYADPEAVRRYALEQSYYLPYEPEAEVAAGHRRASWWASRFRSAESCPFKSSTSLMDALARAVDEDIDRAHWTASFPLTEDDRPMVTAEPAKTCLWNCCFHVKPDNGQRLGDGVHNHVTDRWNSVGVDGWAGIIYLSPDAPVEGGLQLWRNKDSEHRFDWMTSAANWTMIDRFGNLNNRLILVRGDLPHSGAAGWGDSLENGRLFQTFFFKTVAPNGPLPVKVHAEPRRDG